MNLTKGKITKLYNKKRQTLKRKINKKKSSNKSKTFRRNRKINLARKSLKRFHNKKYGGGLGEGEDTMEVDNTGEGEDAMEVDKTGEGEGVKLDDIKLEEEKNGEDIETDGQNVTTGEGNNVDANIQGQEEALLNSKTEETKNGIVGDALSGNTNPEYASPNVVAIEPEAESTNPETTQTAIPVTEAEKKAAAEEEILESALKNSTEPEYANSQENALLTDVDSQSVKGTTQESTDSKGEAIKEIVEGALSGDTNSKFASDEEIDTVTEAPVTEEEKEKAAAAQAQKKLEEEQAAQAQKKLEEEQAAAQKKLEEEQAAAQTQAEQTQTQVVEAAQPQTQVVEAQVPVTQVTPPPEKGPKPNLSDMSVPSDTSLPPDQQNDKLTQAIDTVVDYIADKVSKKVTINVSSSDYTPQNGYEAVKTAAETMASSKGGKKRKTRKFKLTKKNKTRSRT